MVSKQNHTSSKMQSVLVAALAAVGMLILPGSLDAASASRDRWFQITLKTGQTDGYHWAVGAKLPKHERLDKICAMASMIEPFEPDAPYVEGRDSVQCGNLLRPLDSVSGGSAFGSGDSRVMIYIGLYRPAVRKVVFLLGGGERRVFWPRMAKVPNRKAKGIPRFRYFVSPFKGETCIRKVTLFDGSGKAIYREASPPCFGGGNLRQAG